MKWRIVVIFLSLFSAMTIALADGIEWSTSLDDSAKKAKEENKLLFVYFTGPN